MASETWVQAICKAVNRERLVDTAVNLIAVPSPTLNAGAVSHRLADILEADGFDVERPEANWPEAPAVVTRLQGAEKGRTLQMDGHLDTVHLPFVAPSVTDGILRGSGASDMKGGVAACVEALRVLRETDALKKGSVLFTAHDHHEGPWGDKRQVTGLIDAGYVGDAVLFPEYLSDRLPLAGRGMAIFDVVITREGDAVHEVLRVEDLPDVLGTGADLVGKLKRWGEVLAKRTVPYAGADSVFVGQIEAGEIYNQSPITCRLRGTRRWVQPGTTDTVLAEFADFVQSVAKETNTQIEVTWEVQADAFSVSETDASVQAFQAAYRSVTGDVLPFGGKPFVDDGNRYAALAGVPVLTHGPNARGAHTTEEWVPVDELVRVAQVYALMAVDYCADASL
jgi:acetylornithine deacetylase/succinyl-diaminopimelate desuccinylase-like protein